MEERLHRTTLSKFRIGISAGLCSFQGDLVKVMRMGIHSLKAAALKDRLKLDMLPDTGGIAYIELEYLHNREQVSDCRLQGCLAYG